MDSPTPRDTDEKRSERIELKSQLREESKKREKLEAEKKQLEKKYEKASDKYKKQKKVCSLWYYLPTLANASDN